MEKEEEQQGDTPRTMQRQSLAKAMKTAMSKDLEPLLATTETKNKPTKYRGTCDGIIDGWMMLMRRYLQKRTQKSHLWTKHGL